MIMLCLWLSFDISVMVFKQQATGFQSNCFAGHALI
uniref:Uncharacterized protein n=1 Tax=Anguilla anguilla TaxID=7936 RepID=A0A0E9RZU6_ANGAN